MTVTVLRRATTIEGDVTDVRLVDGRVDAVGADLAASTGAAGPEPVETVEVVDLEGWLLVPAAAEPHAHLDKAFLAERVPNLTGDLHGAIEAMEAYRDRLSVADIVERAERAARLLARHGYTAVRTHVDTTVDHGLRSVEALVEVRRRVADVIDVEIVALSGWPVSGHAGADQRALTRDAIELGADLVGGCPHLEFDATTRAATEVLVELAADLGVGLDLHTDETLDPGVDGLSELAEIVATGFEHRVTASHCVSLGQRTEYDQRRIAEAVAGAGIGVVALPHTNLFLQGRGHAPMPRGLTAVRALTEAGVVVAAGADNLQDPFNPVGRGCAFETAGLMVMTAHLLPDDAWRAVADRSRAVLGLEPAGVRPGAVADLLAVPAATVREAIATGPAERMVWRRGIRTR
jgi:cytosine deaminase